MSHEPEEDDFDMATMSPSVQAHLDAHREITLFCRDGAGRPIGYPMFVFARADDEVWFSTYRKSAKVRHIERDPRVALLAMQPEDGRDDATVVRWVSMTGRAEIVSPGAEQLDALMGRRDRVDARVPDTMVELVRQRTLEGKRILVRVPVDDADRCVVEEARR